MLKNRFEMIVYYFVVWIEIPLAIIMGIFYLWNTASEVFNMNSNAEEWSWLLIVLIFMGVGIVIYMLCEWYGLFKWKKFGLYLLYVDVAGDIMSNVNSILRREDIILMLVGIVIVSVKLVCFIRLRDNFK